MLHSNEENNCKVLESKMLARLKVHHDGFIAINSLESLKDSQNKIVHVDT